MNQIMQTNKQNYSYIFTFLLNCCCAKVSITLVCHPKICHAHKCTLVFILISHIFILVSHTFVLLTHTFMLLSHTFVPLVCTLILLVQLSFCGHSAVSYLYSATRACTVTTVWQAMEKFNCSKAVLIATVCVVAKYTLHAARSMLFLYLVHK